ncbi:glycosyltransferase [Nakamurella sp. YIM 132087]|uniref:Glycosyltransferase n=1 Tax=Nakamurella alba TaxID=2665158 RepID=A0A7K1FML8_9ACTN|nr:glycosyltransferase [Nakamurella alba]
MATRRLSRIDLYLPISSAVAGTLHDVDPSRVRVLPSFVPDEVAASVAPNAPETLPRPDFLPPGPFLLAVGQLGEHKGIGTLLEAHRAMRHALPLVLIGPRRPDTPDLSGTPDRPVSVHEGVPHEQIMAAHRAAEVVVAASRWAEPLGLVAVEALAAGTPVVAGDVGGLPDVVGPDCGVLVPPGDAAALAAALDALLDDPERRARLGAAGPARAARFTAAAVLPELEAAYREALEGRASRDGVTSLSATGATSAT